MGFSQATITSISTDQQGSDLKISWTSTSPDGTTYQLYINQQLTDATTNKYAIIPTPQSQISIDVGTVGPGQGGIDFSADLAPAPTDKISLAWCGGTFESQEISGFYVYMGDVINGPVDYTNILADIPAYTGGNITDGFGLGGFGYGGFGESASNYSWTSDVLANGLWYCAVAPYDLAGNVGTPVVVSAYIQAPPIEPAPNALGQRLTYVYNATTQVVTLNWLPSPSASTG